MPSVRGLGIFAASRYCTPQPPYEDINFRSVGLQTMMAGHEYRQTYCYVTCHLIYLKSIVLLEILECYLYEAGIKASFNSLVNAGVLRSSIQFIENKLLGELCLHL